MTYKLDESVFLKSPSVELADPICFEDLLKRWPKFSRERIIDLVSEKKLTAYVSIKDEVNADGERVHESKPIDPGASIYTQSLSNYDSVSIAFMSHNTIFDMPEYYHLRKETVILIIQLHYFHMRIQAYQMILKNTRATGLQSVGIVINRMFYTCLITAALVQ